MSSGARAREKAHVFFYRDNYRRAARVLSWLLALMLIQMVVMGYQLFTRPAPYFFATTTAGDVIELASLTRSAAIKQTREQLQPAKPAPNRQTQQPTT